MTDSTGPVAHDPDAEQAYLGALMLVPQDTAAGLLRMCPPESLYRPMHAEIWRAVARLNADGRPHDWLSVLALLLEGGSKVDGVYLVACVEQCPVPLYAPSYAATITGHARTRRLHEQAARLRQALELTDPMVRDARVTDIISEFSEQLQIGPEAELRGAAQRLDWAQFVVADFTAVEMLTDPLLAGGEQISLIGHGKSGKSLFSLEWAARMTGGLPFLDNPPAHPVRGLYVDQENPHPELQRRLGTLGLTDPKQLDRLTYLSFPPLRPLDTPDGAADLLRLVDRFQPEVIWLDTISRMVQGEENSADTWLAFYRLTVLPIKARRIASVRLDHFGKDAGRGGRGSSAKTQDVDHVWELSDQPGGLLRLQRTHTRTGIGDPIVMMRRQGNPAEPGTTTHARIPWGPKQQSKWLIEREICARLDEAGLALDAPRSHIRDLLRKQGVRISNEQIADIIVFRRALLGEDPLPL